MTWRVRANDGIDPAGQKMLEDAGCIVETDHLEADDLFARIDQYDALLVRSATKVRTDLINKATRLKVIGRGGVGLDNIDVDYAQHKGVVVVNTPAASSASVAELVFAHLFSMVRGLQITNRVMPERGSEEFKALKKKCSKGSELAGKTLGIIGAGRIGRETARIAIGCGMNVQFHDPFLDEVNVVVRFHPDLKIEDQTITIDTISKEALLKTSDFVSLHIPGGGETVIGHPQFELMKEGAGLVNCARGGVVDEESLVNAMNSGKIAYAGVDVFAKEPPVYTDILKLENVSLSPHIGAATAEAQQRVGEELADKVIAHLSKVGSN